jgi:hypothetical protein
MTHSSWQRDNKRENIQLTKQKWLKQGNDLVEPIRDRAFLVYGKFV